MHDYYYFQSKSPQIHIIKSQRELLKLLASGLTLGEIAVKTGKNLNNIKKRVRLLYQKFDINKRQELITSAVNEGFISHRDITQRFRKRFAKPKINKKIITNAPDLSERELKLLILKSQSIKQKDMIDQLGLWSYYGLKRLEFYVCEKFECKNILEAIVVAKRLGII